MANNCASGIIIFGIEDATRAIVGIRNPSSTNDVVLRAARMIKPAVLLGETSVQLWTIDGYTIITVEIPPNNGRLYQYDGACYVRRGTSTLPLSVEEIDAFLKAYGATRWEYELCPQATLDDINTEALERYLAYRAEESRARQRYSSSAELLLGLHAAARDPQTGDIRSTHAGMLMFGYDPSCTCLKARSSASSMPTPRHPHLYRPQELHRAAAGSD